MYDDRNDAQQNELICFAQSHPHVLYFKRSMTQPCMIIFLIHRKLSLFPEQFVCRRLQNHMRKVS